MVRERKVIHVIRHLFDDLRWWPDVVGHLVHTESSPGMIHLRHRNSAPYATEHIRLNVRIHDNGGIEYAEAAENTTPGAVPNDPGGENTRHKEDLIRVPVLGHTRNTEPIRLAGGCIKYDTALAPEYNRPPVHTYHIRCRAEFVGGHTGWARHGDIQNSTGRTTCRNTSEILIRYGYRGGDDE